MKRLAVFLALSFAWGCGAVGGVLTPGAAPAAATAAGEIPLAVRWVADSAEYRAALIQAYRLAGERLEKLVAGLEAGTWAVALDTDETVLSNLQYELETARAGERFTPQSFAEWVSRQQAPPLPGVLDFLQRVRSLGGRIVIVTNRWEPLCPDTEANYLAYDVPFDVILCGSGRKEPRWKQVENGTAAPDLPPLEIVMWIGDNIRDFPGLDQDLRFAEAVALDEFGRRYFVLPNPMYGSWEENE